MSIIEDSSVYQMILDKGKKEGAIEELRKTILRQGQRRFGLPHQAMREALAAITDLNRLERMSERVLDVANWEELLATI